VLVVTFIYAEPGPLLILISHRSALGYRCRTSREKKFETSRFLSLWSVSISKRFRPNVDYSMQLYELPEIIGQLSVRLLICGYGDHAIR